MVVTVSETQIAAEVGGGSEAIRPLKTYTVGE